MKGFRLNPNKEYVMKIIEGTLKKDGHCPCKVSRDDSNLCPCDEFIKEKVCHCKLFLPIED